jgi:GDP-L-fucose synthase
MRHFDPTEALAHASAPEVVEYAERRRMLARSGQPGELQCSPGYWRNLRVMVTGSSRFLGELVVEQLGMLGCEQVLVPSAGDFDLARQDEVERLYRDARPDIVLHLAEQVGGIGANRSSPADFFYQNLLSGMLMIEEARKHDVRKFVQMGSITAYPKYTTVPFREEDLWEGFPDESNAPFGIAKRTLLVQLQAYRRQHGFTGVYLVPANMYGPRDDFDPERSYVIPALIRKMIEAKKNGDPQVEVWGSGEASREFLYVDDCARAILLAAEHFEGPEPVNVGTGEEIKIRRLAELIAELVGFTGALVFARSRPEGQPRRRLNTRRAQQLFGFVAHTSLREGLSETIGWYRENQ